MAVTRTPEQRIAADPARHVWVAASAGTGKTHVLTDRLLRLMLEGSPPDRILALTFTRAAAAEMQNRLVKRLGQWQGLGDAELDAELSAMGLAPDTALRRRARSLFGLALDVPGGLKVHTLHAFAQGLLAAFPVEAGLPPGFRALDTRDSRQLRRRALADSIADAQGSGDTGFLADLAQLSVLKSEGGVMQALDTMIANADALLAYRDPAAFEPAVRRFLEVGENEQVGERLKDYLAPGLFDDRAHEAFAGSLERWGWKTPLEQAAELRGWLALDGEARAASFSRLCAVYFTSAGEMRSFRQGEKAVPGLQASAEHLANDLRHLQDLDRRVETALFAARALRAGHRIVARYAALKRAAVAIDYDDMIARTAALLGPPGMPGYVAWKLDSRYDHVLVDEAQDTNSRQWAIIGKLVEEYFAPDESRSRSLFVVGDYKQAIYGFQGADPREFLAWRSRLSPGQGARGIETVDLDLSFRSGPAVLDLVNIFLEQQGAEALGMEALPPPHRPHRAEAAGEVVLWPIATPPDDEEAEAAEQGEDALEDGSEAADREMARRLGLQVGHWLREGDPHRLWLPARGRWARPEDILILLRRRSWLMGALVAELHRNGVPVAGVDRLLLTEPLAVLDCLALVRFAVQPEDDLTVATLLASPFLGWEHEAIRQLNGGRPGLWAALGSAAAGAGPAADARAWLGTCLALADTVGPYAFLDTILSGPLGGRRRLVTRLGAEANDPVDELLQQALAFEQANPPALAGFLAWIEAEGSEVKRDAEGPAGQVRLMTIHGSKGLEAPVVVLADSAHQRRPRADGHVLADLDGQRLPLFHPPTAECAAKLLALRDIDRAADAQEDLRLLYVGLTRAADHLYIGGATSQRATKQLADNPDRCWHGRLEPAFRALEGCEPVITPWGEALRIRRGAWSAPAPVDTPLAPAVAQMDFAEVLVTPAPPPGRPARPLTPSAMPEPPPQGPAAEAMRAAAFRGTLIHRLFQQLPALPPPERHAQGLAWLAAQGAGAQASAILAEVLAVIEDPAHAALFGLQALAEAPLAGLVADQVITGVVDRLLVEDARILVVDFKTGLSVPASAGEAPVPHRRQMAAYRAVLAQAFPGRRIDAALLYTAAPKFLLLEDKHMESLLPLD
jgi:ATP-dependent helicase/nuclease subunit A